MCEWCVRCVGEVRGVVGAGPCRRCCAGRVRKLVAADSLHGGATRSRIGGGNDLPPMGGALSGQAYWSLRGLGTSLGSSTRSAEIAGGAARGARSREVRVHADRMGCVRGVGCVCVLWAVGVGWDV